MIHINTLEIENVKRVQALTLYPSETGLTVIGGRNNQGKTSVLDAIAWGLGGEKFRPSHPQREGSNTPPRLKITLSNGLLVERSGKNSALKVTDPSGRRAGQQLLNEFVEQLALDLPKFMSASDKEKANTLLRILGIEDELARLDQEEAKLYNQRLLIGREADKKAKYADQLPEIPGAPDQELSAIDLIQRQQRILLRNAENQRKRQHLAQLQAERASLLEQIDLLQDQLAHIESDLSVAAAAAQDLQDESTAELEADLHRIDQINQQVRINAEKRRATEEARDLRKEYDQLSYSIEAVRQKRRELLDGADLPLPGLTVEKGILLYNGQPWDNMSGSDQLRVATAIVRKLNPSCGFVLLDKLEQMDTTTLREFGRWLEQEGLQAIATRVSTGGECDLLIEDGLAATAQTVPTAPPRPAATWTKGVF